MGDMEVCGGQTHAIIRHGVDQLLPAGVELIHGPGCPVCVTPLGMIDKALAIATRPEVIFTAGIGVVTEQHPGLVVARNSFGTRRVIDLPLGEQLPRIC